MVVILPGPWGVGWGGTPIYGLYRYLPRNRVWFLRFSVLKSGIFFYPSVTVFLLWSSDGVAMLDALHPVLNWKAIKFFFSFNVYSLLGVIRVWALNLKIGLGFKNLRGTTYPKLAGVPPVILSHLSGSVSTMFMLKIADELLGQILSALDSRCFEDLAKIWSCS